MKHFILQGINWGFPRGWGNGYVVIPKGHPLHGVPYMDIENIDVHGGLTFGEMVEKLEDWEEWSNGKITKEDIGCYVVGFDTAHTCSNESMDMDWVEQETIRLKEQLQTLKPL